MTARARRASWTGCASRARPATSRWRCSPAASSPSRPSSRPVNWSRCSTATSSAPPKACSSMCPWTTTTPRSGRHWPVIWADRVSTSERDNGSRRSTVAGDGRVRVTCGTDEIAACAVVVAADPATTRDPAARQSGSAMISWQARVAATSTAPPFAVWRLWLDRRVDAERPPFLGTSGFGPLDNITVLERFEAGARRWADEHGGSVVEVHAYALTGEVDPAAVKQRLRGRIAPGLSRARRRGRGRRGVAAARRLPVGWDRSVGGSVDRRHPGSCGSSWPATGCAVTIRSL